MFENLDSYFAECTNCGDCCHTPGDLLPEQVDILANHFRLDRRQLFDKYMVLQIFAPDPGAPPAFLVSPVKSDRNGKRLPQKIVDRAYLDIKHLDCIFRDQASNSCSVHDVKPFACGFLVCAKATRANPILLNNLFFYHRWIDSLDIIFSVYPGLQLLHKQLTEIALRFSRLEKQKTQAIEERNRVTGLAVRTIMGAPEKPGGR
jgi:Fe-S-cluster containining protein